MKERNPNIVFSFHKANGEGVENLEFDFFQTQDEEENDTMKENNFTQED